MLLLPSALHQRMAELWVEKKRRSLSKVEEKELEICLDANVNYCWKIARLKNLSLLASMTSDIEWQHEICAKLDELIHKSDQ